MVNRQFTNISCKDLGQLISLKDSASRKVAKNSVYDNESVYYMPAIRLYILLNFKVYTKDGTATDLSLKETAAEIGCCQKTVLNALDRLSSGSEPLLSYEMDEDTKLFSVKLLNYQDMFKRRGEGGLRYIVFDFKMFEQMKEIGNINEMRLCIRTLIECEEQDGSEASLTVKQIMRGLPSYIRPCNVRSYIDNLKSVFKTNSNVNNSAYLFSLFGVSEGKKWRNKLFSVNEKAVRNIVSEFNRQIEFINDLHRLSKNNEHSMIDSSVSADIDSMLHVSFDWKKASESGMKELPSFHFRAKEYEEAAIIATHLSLDAVNGAIKKYMESYVLTGMGSTRNDTMSVIQNIAEHIYMKSKTFFLGKSEEEMDEAYLPAT